MSNKIGQWIDRHSWRCGRTKKGCSAKLRASTKSCWWCHTERPEKDDEPIHRMLMINACCQCRYFEFVRGLTGFKKTPDRTYCNFYNQRIIPQTVDPSDNTPQWCPLPEAK